MPVINKAKRMRWEDHEFEASLGYTFKKKSQNITNLLEVLDI
jgi:hypothetical protein